MMWIFESLIIVFCHQNFHYIWLLNFQNVAKIFLGITIYNLKYTWHFFMEWNTQFSNNYSILLINFLDVIIHIYIYIYIFAFFAFLFKCLLIIEAILLEKLWKKWGFVKNIRGRGEVVIYGDTMVTYVCVLNYLRKFL